MKTRSVNIVGRVDMITKLDSVCIERDCEVYLHRRECRVE